MLVSIVILPGSLIFMFYHHENTVMFSIYLKPLLSFTVYRLLVNYYEIKIIIDETCMSLPLI